MRSLVPAIIPALLVLILSLLPATAVGQASEDPALMLEVHGSPLLVPRDGPGIEVSVRLAEPAELRLWVEDFDGREVREIFSGRRDAGTLTRTWLGRDEDGDPVAPGPYRIMAQASGDDATAGLPAASMAWVTVAERPVYPTRPGSITVAVDPGHGGSADGAVGADGTREAYVNLDVGLRLARMLQGAGVNVVLTRSQDVDVNTPPIDRTGDGLIDDTDELAARPDLANQARADLFLAVHNNIAVDDSVGGPSTFYFDERSFGDRSRRLARLIQDEMVSALAGIAPDAWRPFDHGALIYPYYVLRDFDPPRLLRPTQMPGVLSEGLFLSNPRELRFLRQPRVRQAMAAAYYEAIARYLAERGAQVGYQLTEAPPGAAMAGEPATLHLEVRNQGSEPLRGWALVVGALPADSPSVWRARGGTTVGRRRLPPLAPGASASFDIPLTAPAPGGRWTLMVDAEDAAGRRASAAGSPMLLVPMSTLDALPPPVCCFVPPHDPDA